MSDKDIRLECIEYSGYRNSKGYGVRRFEGKNVGAHRLAYCEHHGLHLREIEGQLIRHRCDNPPCVNPDHLLVGTHADNVADMFERGRNVPSPGLRHGRAKLTMEMIEAIKAECRMGQYGKGVYVTAKKYGVSPRAIRRLMLGISYKEEQCRIETPMT